MITIDKIKYQRKTRYGLTQEQLADLVGVSRSAVNNWESGTSSPTMRNLIMLSNTLNVSINYFLSNPEITDEILLNKLTEQQREIINTLIDYFEFISSM